MSAGSGSGHVMVRTGESEDLLPFPGDAGRRSNTRMSTAEPAALARVRLEDGREVTISPLTGADAKELGEAIREADPETLYRRFCGPPPRVTPRLLRYLTELNGVRRFALVARDQRGNGVALARYEDTGEPGIAEVAVTVDPAWRTVGLATALLRLLAQTALAHGYTHFTATYLTDNRDVSDLLAEADARQTIAEGVAQALVRLPREDGAS